MADILFPFQNVTDSGRKYQLELSVHEMISNVGHVFVLIGEVDDIIRVFILL